MMIVVDAQCCSRTINLCERKIEQVECEWDKMYKIGNGDDENEEQEVDECVIRFRSRMNRGHKQIGKKFIVYTSTTSFPKCMRV